MAHYKNNEWDRASMMLMTSSFCKLENGWGLILSAFGIMQVSDKMDPNQLVKLIEILNPQNKAGRITVITRMGAENMRVKLPHLIRAVRRAGQIVTWVSDPMHGNTIKAPCGLKTRPFDAIRVLFSFCYFLLFQLCLILAIFHL